MAVADEALLAVDDLRVEIGRTPILHGAGFVLNAGQLVAVVGPNGAGKSTLVRAAAGLQPSCGGTVRWSGRDVRTLRRRQLARLRAFVPQRARVPDGIVAREAVLVGRAPHVGALARPTQRDHEVVEQAMERSGVAELADRRLSTLSGGELQRVQIAVALAQDAPVLMADEPTAHLDLGATVAVARLLRRLADDGLGVVLVAHDLALAAAIADHVVVVSDGRTVAAGRAEDVLDGGCLEEVWAVDAALHHDGRGRAGLSVAWLSVDIN
jgi:iron complex transport system ATP-binding protein